MLPWIESPSICFHNSFWKEFIETVPPSFRVITNSQDNFGLWTISFIQLFPIYRPWNVLKILIMWLKLFSNLVLHHSQMFQFPQERIWWALCLLYSQAKLVKTQTYSACSHMDCTLNWNKVNEKTNEQTGWTYCFKAAEHDLVAVFHRPQQIIFNFSGSFLPFFPFHVISW